MHRPLKETVYSPDSELLSGSGHHGNGEVRVHPELGASVCQPSTRFARIPPGPLLKKGGSYPLEIQKRHKSRIPKYVSGGARPKPRRPRQHPSG
jgi:hypothetical protein